MQMRYSRKNTLYEYIMILCLTPCLASCSGQGPLNGDFLCKALIELNFGELETKASPDEDGIWDVNLFVYDSVDGLYGHEYITLDGRDKRSVNIKSMLRLKEEYSIYAIANVGYDIGAKSIPELLDWKVYIANPQGNLRGIPSAGCCKAFLEKDGGSIAIDMTRMMAKVSIRLDKSKLDGNVHFDVSGIRVGNCPKCASAFKASGAESSAEIFNSGYYSNWNSSHDLYLMENVHAQLDKSLCSYIEMEIDYESPQYNSWGHGLVYRFFIKDGGKYSVERNCHYTITVQPQGDGLLSQDSWRVDKSNLTGQSKSAYLRIIPGGTAVDDRDYDNYFEMAKGESRHFDLDYYPPWMDVHFREDLLDDEKAEGRVEYLMDSDSKGFTAKSLGKTCLSMMEIIAEDPLSDNFPLAISVK